MTQEAMESWKPRYLLVQIFLVTVGALAGYLVPKLFEKSPAEQRTLLFDCPKTINRATKGFGLVDNLLNPEEDQLVAEFYLRSQPKQKLSHYFEYRCEVWNPSEIGVENLDLYFAAPGGMTLVKKPRIQTEPVDIVRARKFEQLETLAPNTDHWKVSLANPDEKIVFRYIGYSTGDTELVDFSSELTLSLHTRDWRLLPVGRKASAADKSFFEKRLSDFTGEDAWLLLLLALAMWVYFSIGVLVSYRYWRRLIGKRARSVPSLPTEQG